MTRQPSTFAPPVVIQATLVILLSIGIAEAQKPPIVQPGSPGQKSKVITADEATTLAGLQHIEADVQFVQGMIAHHAQAVEMVGLLTTRTEQETMRQLGLRITLSQEDEIKMMQEWLRTRGLEVPDAQHAHHTGHMQTGMLTPEQMAQLAAAKGAEFDRLFLELMIQHHRGALTMVEELLAQEGAAQDPQLFGFTSDITDDQSAEIERMDNMLREFSPDKRVHLKAGFQDAGEASWNLERVVALSKPAGFFDPKAPAGRPVRPERRPEGAAQPNPAQRARADAGDKADADAAATDGKGADPGAKKGNEANPETADDRLARSPLLNFVNSDLAFAGDLVIQGNYHGFNSYLVENPERAQLLASVVCPGGQGDVSIYRNLLFMSVEQTRGRIDCGLQGVAARTSKERFRGVRIFDISDIRMPRQVAAVQTCRGSHTHTLVPDPNDKDSVYVYGSGTGSVRPGDEIDGCSETAGDPNTALYSIDVIKVPLARPEEARIVSRPRIFADTETGAIAGLWKGGDHGPGTQKTSETNRCHDITVFPELKLAAGACSGNGILFDISKPETPVRLDQVVDRGFAFWHSATFNNDGTKVIFTDEWGGGSRPRCRAGDPRNWGADAIFDIVDKKLQFRSYYKLPAPQTELENCVAHNGSLVPVPGRDIMVQAWYQGGISVFDFTDAARPAEIAYFDRGPMNAEKLVMGGYWSAYWYDGHIYGSEIGRGLDVFKLLPSEHLTKNEIAAAELVKPGLFNPQQQSRIEWPVSPVVARAYVDQLQRSGTFAAPLVQAVNAALDRVERGNAGSDVAKELEGLAADVEKNAAGANGRDKDRLRSLASVLKGVARNLRG